MKMLSACNFFLDCLGANASRIAVENPIMHCYAKERIKIEYTQIIQPWQFGHGEVKATCLWLKGLPELQPTKIVEGRNPRGHKMTPNLGIKRGLLRAITLNGVAEAMTEQWGGGR